MRASILHPTDSAARDAAVGAIICQEVTVNRKRLFHKGHCIGAGDLSALASIDHPIHILHLEPSDVHEDEAAHRLASAIAGPGLQVRPPVQSRVNVTAERKGLLRVDRSRLAQLNALPGVAIFTLLDRIPVLPGKIVSGAKITPVAAPNSVIVQAEQIASGTPIVEVKGFHPLQVGVITTEGLADTARDRFRSNVEHKIAWFGGSVLGYADLVAEPASVAAAITDQIAAGAEVILTGGGNTIDPLDATLLALQTIGAEMVAFGAAAHPGSMFWLAYHGSVPIFNLASCSMYSKATVADLVLPWIMAGERPTAGDFADLGYGGLLDRDMAFRFPAYDQTAAEDEE